MQYRTLRADMQWKLEQLATFVTNKIKTYVFPRISCERVWILVFHERNIQEPEDLQIRDIPHVYFKYISREEVRIYLKSRTV